MLLLGATNWLVVVGFECLIMQPKVALHHKRFGHPLWPHVPDWDVDSSCVTRWVCSMCAGGNCDSDAPFCDRCNTQLHGGLLLFLLLILSAYIRLAEYILHGAWLRDSFPCSLLRILLFILLTYPLHLDQLAFAWVSILVDERWLYHHGVPSAVLSYGCSLVGD